jgi:cytochrome P450
MDDQSERSVFPEWDPLAPHVLADQRSVYDEMRGRCPVAHSDLLGWSVLRHADVLEVVHDHETYRNLVSRHLSVPNGMDPPDHTSYRRLIEPYFAPGPMAQFEPVSDMIAADLVASAPRGRPIEVMDTLGREFAVRVQCAFMGWSSDLHHPLRAWLDEQHRATLAEDRDALAASARQFDDVVRQLLAARRDASGDPDEFRLDRDPALNLLYGAGIHECPGAPLARLELESFVTALLDGTERLRPVFDPASVRATYPSGGYQSAWIVLDPT